MSVRILLVLTVLASFYGCGQSSSPPEQGEMEGSAESKSVISTSPAEEETVQQEKTAPSGASERTQSAKLVEDLNGKITFLRSGNIYEMNADGTGVTKVIDTSFDIGFNADMSPNGEKIAFQSIQGGEDLYVMNTDGTGPKIRLTEGYHHSVLLGWRSK